MQLTVLVENTAQGRSLMREHGLAFWIKVGSKRVLFDTGQTGTIWSNARRLNIDLADAESIVLSHGHYDHTGGLAAVLEQTGWMSVYLHPQALAAKYARNGDGTARDVGMPRQSRQALDRIGNDIFTKEPVQISEGLWCTGPIPRITDYEDTGGAFFTDTECQQPDELLDDQAAFIDTSEGVVVILGCAHAGIINTLYYVKKLLPECPINTVIGGAHLARANQTRMRKTIEALRALDVQHLFPLHCTGFSATARLAQDLPGRVSDCPAGTTIELT